MKSIFQWVACWALCCCLCSPPLLAAPISDLQASNAVFHAVTGHNPASTKGSANAMATLKRTVGRVDKLVLGSEAVGYVVKLNPSGYYLVANDDQLPPWKLRSEGGNLTNLPPGLLAVIKLEMAEDQQNLKTLLKANKSPNPRFHEQWQTMLSATSSAFKANIVSGEPGNSLLTTTWTQVNPYDYYCPTSYASPDGRSPVGCVACAMAQILKFYNQPAIIKANHTYTDNKGACQGIHSISDAGMGPYNWAAMPDYLGYYSSDAQTLAVGRLMYHCAVAVEANFEDLATGAYASHVSTALQTYFGYSCSSLISKKNYTSSQWYDKIVSDVSQHHPVFYSILAADGISDGHAVVCDGYQNGNEIHLNLGWASSDNAWYNIDTISDRDYTWTVHSAVFGITPPLPPANTAPCFTSPQSGTTFYADLPSVFTQSCPAADSDWPPQTLSYKLLTGPSGSTLDSKGKFSWQPRMAQINTSAQVTIVVTDNGSPALCATDSFYVVVNIPNLAYTSLSYFNADSDGAAPQGLVFAGGTIYGVTTSGGGGNGTVFKMNTDGSNLAALCAFSAVDENGANSDGATPVNSLILADSTLYGATANGGSLGYGTVFKVNTDGTGYTVIKNFGSANDGANPLASLQLSGSTLFGTTYTGGKSNLGTLFRMDTDGTGYAVIHDFSETNPSPGLTLSGNVLYGSYQGLQGGAVYRLDTHGAGYTVIKRFSAPDGNGCNSDGAYPYGLLVSGSKVYGTALYGGTAGCGTVFKMATNGTSFALLRTFDVTQEYYWGNDGAYPLGSLVLSGNVLFGATTWGYGTLFKVNTDGSSFAVLRGFDGDYGGNPQGNLMLSGRRLYGTTSPCYFYSGGTIFEMDLPSFETTRPTVSIVTPTANQRLDYPASKLTGTASDNSQLGSVYFQLNGGDWNYTSTTNSGANWSAALTLTTRTNKVSAYAVDASGNLSTTNSVNFFYFVSSPMTVHTNGFGSVKTNYNGQVLELGEPYSMTATAGAGFAFTNWTDDSANLVTNGPTVAFLMASNLSLTANFVDTNKPTLSITNLTTTQRLSNSIFTVKGTAKDNVAISEVFYQLNSTGWSKATTTIAGPNWSAPIMLTTRSNIIQAYAIDSSGNLSATSCVSVVYAYNDTLTVHTSGAGTVRTNLSGQKLEIGQGYTMTATGTNGFAFTNWTSNLIPNCHQATISFIMQSNLALTANFVDVTVPTVAITSPTNYQRWSNSTFKVSGKANDNAGVSAVYCQLQTNPWQLATTSNGWTNWAAVLTLSPGSNVVRSYAVDTCAHISVTNITTLIYVVTSPLAVLTNGYGTVSPNLNRLILAVGTNYSMTATATNGFAFANWTSNLGLLTNKSTLRFMMQSNLVLTANFVDVTLPTIAITSPTNYQRWSNATFTVRGKANDNAKVAEVWYQVQTNAWQLATTTNGWTNWTAVLTVAPGPNVVRAYALDTGSRVSTTNSLTLVYVVSAPLIVQTNGYGSVIANLNHSVLAVGTNYSMTAWPTNGFAFTNWTSNLGIGTNKATIRFIMQSNLVLTANFADITLPTVAITTPTNYQRWSNATMTVRGTSRDNAAVTNVVFSINNTLSNASTTNNWSNWWAEVNLVPGTNFVKARSQDSSGRGSLTNSVTFVYFLTAPIVVRTNGNGTVLTNYNGQKLQLGVNYSMTATAGRGQIFSNWTGNGDLVLTNGRTLQFNMQSNLTFTANFTANPFLPTAGTYQGLFQDTNGVALQSSGFFSALVDSNGGFSVNLLGASNYSFSSQFPLTGAWSTNAVSGKGSPAAWLQLDLGNQNRITGQIGGGDWTAELAAYRNVFSRTIPAPEAGKKYTLAIAGSGLTSAPAGNGYGTVSVDTNGNVTFSGTLGDGAKVTPTASVSQEGLWPFYASLYSGKGALSGWLVFTNATDRDIDGVLTWIKLPRATTNTYLAGFTNEVEANGSLFNYTNAIRSLNLTNGVIILNGGNLPIALTNSFTLRPNNTGTGTNLTSLTITNSGLFSGSLTNPATRKSIQINGVLLQKQNAGYGQFSGTNQTGSVLIEER